MFKKLNVSKHFFFGTASLFLLFVLAGVTAAQTVIKGDWKAEFKPEKQDKIYLSFSRQTERGSQNQHSSNYLLNDLQGLSSSQLSASDANVNFRLAREAGTIECQGKFTNGRGSGTFRFTANPQFVSAMKSRGFDFEKPSENKFDREPENRLFAAATLNVTTALADDLLSANFGKLDTDDLFKAAIFKVDSKFMKEMKASGFPNLDFDDLVKARIFKIDGEYLRQLNASGFGKEPFENVVKMKIFNITPEFIAEVRSEGLNNLSIEELTKMKIFNINGAFIRQAKAEKVDLNVESLVRRKLGVWNKGKSVVWN